MKLTKNQIVASLGVALVAGLVLAPTAYAAANVFGLEYGSATGLGKKDVRETVSTIINVALSLLGIVALVIVLIGGFEWMTAGGNEEKTGEARKRIIAGVIGLAIILSAYALTKFVFNQLASATGTTGQNGQTTQLD